MGVETSHGSGLPAQWLSEWLTAEGLELDNYVVTHHRESNRPDDVDDKLADLIRHAKCSPKRLRNLLERVKWMETGKSARLARPKTIQLANGDFGEVLAIGLLETRERQLIPVVKLRTQADKDSSIHGTDLVCLEMAEGDDLVVSNLDFVEVKVRSSGKSNAKMVAHEAHAQLVADRQINFQDTLEFISQVLYDRSHPLSDAFDDHLASRESDVGGGNRIVLVIESDDYGDVILEQLPEPPELCDPLAVDVVHVDDLKALIVSTWEKVAPGLVLVDDE